MLDKALRMITEEISTAIHFRDKAFENYEEACEQVSKLISEKADEQDISYMEDVRNSAADYIKETEDRVKLLEFILVKLVEANTEELEKLWSQMPSDEEARAVAPLRSGEEMEEE